MKRKLIGRSEHVQNDTYLCSYSNQTFGIVEIPFKIENDKVTGLTLRVAGFIESTPYEFRKTN